VGKSALCAKLCYANRGHFLYASCQDKYEQNYRLFKRSPAEWTETIGAQLDKEGWKFVRIHVSGDFDSVEYIRAWHNIIVNHPDKHFYAYTRSWRDERLLHSLIRMSKLPNCTLNLSCDKETGIPTKLSQRLNLRTCYLSIGDDDIPKEKVGIVFRNNTHTVQKYMHGQVCPYETGLAKIKNFVNCEKCKLCIKKARPKDGVVV
jgi:hypothetical protein